MKRKGVISNHYGFTLIEIIAVLIILGILAAVAVPRYLDMTEDAHESAVAGAISAAVGNYNLAFSRFLAEHKTVPNDLNTTANTLSDGTNNLLIEVNLGDFTAVYVEEATNQVKITIDSTTDGATPPVNLVSWFDSYIAANAGADIKIIPAGVEGW